MIDNNGCRSCGAAVNGVLCHFCGSLTAAVTESGAERKALDEFHGLLTTADCERQSRLPTTGFLPDVPEVLVEAGLRTIPLIDDNSVNPEPTASAIRRLDAIIVKLRLHGNVRENARAADEFAARLKRSREADEHSAKMGLIVFPLLLLIIAAAAGYVLIKVFH